MSSPKQLLLFPEQSRRVEVLSEGDVGAASDCGRANRNCCCEAVNGVNGGWLQLSEHMVTREELKALRLLGLPRLD